MWTIEVARRRVAGIQQVYRRDGIGGVGSTTQAHARRLARGAVAATRSHYTVDANGTAVTIRVDAATKALVHWTPNWKSQLIDGVLALREGVFLDVGANVGQTLLDYCSTRRRAGYIGFEPIPACAAIVSALIEENSLDDCAVVPVALSDHNGVAPLCRHPTIAADPCATLVEDLRPDWRLRRILVPCARLDDIRNDVGAGGAVALVKIDVEGGEADVMAGMDAVLSADRPVVLCEVLDRHATADAAIHRNRRKLLTEQLQDQRYDIVALERRRNPSAVTGLRRVDGFRDRVFTDDSRLECDYLFVPRDDAVLMDRLGGLFA